MKLYGITHYAEWSCAITDQFRALGLDLDDCAEPPYSINADRESQLAIAIVHNVDATLLTDVKSLWNELKKRDTEPDTFKTYFDLHKKAMETYDSSKLPSEVHIQTFARNMAHLNTLARTHDLDEIPDWYQVVVLVADLLGDGVEEGKMYAAFKDAKMKSLAKLKLKNLTADSVEGAHWEKEFEIRRGGPEKQGVKNEEVKEGSDGAVETRKKAVAKA